MALSNELISQFAKMSKDNKRESKETTVYGKIVQIDNTKYVQIDGSDRLTPISSTTDALNGERVTVMIKDHKAIVNGNISSPSARTGTVKEIDDRVVAQGNDINAINNNIDAQNNNINAQNNNITAIGNTVNAQNSKITAIESNISSIGDTVTSQGNTITSQGNTITALNNDISIYNSSFQITNGVVTGIKGVETEWIKTEDLEADHATITSLDSTYANVDFANIGEAAVEKFYSVSGIIQNLTLETGVVVKELIGVLISGDLIRGNTIQADKLIVRGEDGLYYKLNVDALGETTASADEKYQNGLDGSVIIAKSVTAEKVSVSDLVAFGATIGGFHITGTDTENNTPGAIYSGVKSSVDNTTVGICLDSKGQIAIGDADNFIKFYEYDKDKYKLEISAESMTFGARKKDLERSVNNLDDSMNSVDEKMLDITSLLYEVTYNSDTSTYTITDKRISSSDISNVSILLYEVTYNSDDSTYTITNRQISSSDISNVSIVEGKVTTTGEQIYSGTDANGLTFVAGKVTTTGEQIYSGKDANDFTVYFSKVQVSSNDLQDSVDDNSKRLEAAESFIENLGDKLITTVKDSEGKTSLEQTSSGWTFNLDALNNTVNETKEDLGKAKKDIGDPETETGLYGETAKLFKKFADQDEYIKIEKSGGQPYLELGNSSEFKVKITNDEIQFFEGSTKVAYISNQQLYIEKAIIKNELEIGNNSGFIWKSRDNGNMGLQWFKRDDSEITYTITYDANGGTGTPASQTKIRGEDLILQSEVQPIKSGYTFMGWSTTKNGNVCYKCGWPCSENCDLVLYAVWEEYYTVTFDAKGGTGAPDPITFPSGSGAEIPSTIPTKDGYTFMGWDMYSSGDMVYLRPGDTYAADSDQTLYAVWVAESSSTADGSSFDKAIPISLDAEVNVEMPDGVTDLYYTFTPSEDGDYIFESYNNGSMDPKISLYNSSDTNNEIGSNDDIDGSNNRNFKLTQSLTSGTVYYLKIHRYSTAGTFNFSVTKESSTTTTYTITFDVNGGTGAPDPITFSSGSSVEIPSTTPTRDGYTFIGWDTSSTATTASYQSGVSYNIGGDIYLYAVWVEESSSTADGSSFDKAIPISSGDTITATKTSKNQYIYYKFTPSESGSYTFQSTGASNTLDADAFLYSTDHTQLANHYDINGTSDRNFKLTYHYFTENTTYYFAVNFWDSSDKTDISTGSINFSVTKESGSSTTTYNIKYYPNHGLNNGNANSYNETKTHGQPYTIRSIEYFSVSMDGYTFAGWSTSSDALTVSYLPGDSYTTDADLTLYAVWYVEDYDSGDGSSAETAYTLTLNETMAITNIGEGERKWCKFTPSTTSEYTFSINSSGECVFVLTDDASGNTYITRFISPSCSVGMANLTAGTTYYVMLASVVANNTVSLTVSN